MRAECTSTSQAAQPRLPPATNPDLASLIRRSMASLSIRLRIRWADNRNTAITRHSTSKTPTKDNSSNSNMADSKVNRTNRWRWSRSRSRRTCPQSCDYAGAVALSCSTWRWRYLVASAFEIYTHLRVYTHSCRFVGL